MKATTMPVVIGALGLLKKEMNKYIQKILCGIRIQELHKITLHSSSHDLRNALSIK